MGSNDFVSTSSNRTESDAGGLEQFRGPKIVAIVVSRNCWQIPCGWCYLLCSALVHEYGSTASPVHVGVHSQSAVLHRRIVSTTDLPVSKDKSS